jgi:putative two-component system response regulator
MPCGDSCPRVGFERQRSLLESINEVSVYDGRPHNGASLDEPFTADAFCAAFSGDIRAMTVPSRARVLVVEDDEASRAALVELLTADGYRVEAAADGEAAIATIDRAAPDLVLLDVGLPGIDGFGVCRRIKQRPATRLIPVVLVTGMNERDHRIAGIHAGADDFLTKPINVEELQARVASLLRLKRYTDELDSADSVILSLAMTVEARDAYTEGHCQRLATYATALGRALGLGEEDLGALHRGGYLHDVGKIAIPDVILQKPTKLTDAEFELIKQHPVIGETLCGDLRSLAAVRPIVRHHHELRNGRGYPDGLRDDEIPLLAQIVGIVDTYDAITTTRPYRSALPAEHAYTELRQDAANGLRRFDLVDTFVRLGTHDITEFRRSSAAVTPKPAVRY